MIWMTYQAVRGVAHPDSTVEGGVTIGSLHQNSVSSIMAVLAVAAMDLCHNIKGCGLIVAGFTTSDVFQEEGMGRHNIIWMISCPGSMAVGTINGAW